jgi:hypothetical protein
MRLPFTPLKLDHFRPEDGVEVFLLSHFHTDHMVGLCDGWNHGVIYCTAVTRALVLAAFQIDPWRLHTLPLDVEKPVVVWSSSCDSNATVFPAHGTSNAARLLRRKMQRHSEADDGLGTHPQPTSISVVTLSAQHIVGSAMFVIRCLHGTVLYTGDFKYDEHTMPAQLSRQGDIDHAFVDSTWLHLARDKFITLDELRVAFVGIGRRMAWEASSRPLPASSSKNSSSLPFVLRVYLHNQFGKEPLLQLLADAVHADVFVDAKRLEYIRVASLAETDPDHKSLRLSAFRPLWQLRQYLLTRTAQGVDASSGGSEAAPSLVGESDGPHDSSPTEAAEVAADEECAEDGDDALSIGAMALEELAAAAAELGDEPAPSVSLFGEQRDACAPPWWAAHCGADRRGAVEVVCTRTLVSEASLLAEEQRTGIPHFGVVMSGWARLNGRAKSARVWHLPYSLHSSGRDVEELVRLLSPRSVYPLSTKPGRSKIVVQRLGPLLREPMRNDPCSLASLHRLAGLNETHRTEGQGQVGVGNAENVRNWSTRHDSLKVVRVCGANARGIRVPPPFAVLHSDSDGADSDATVDDIAPSPPVPSREGSTELPSSPVLEASSEAPSLSWLSSIATRA